ncbi:hypothetical protein SH449x_005396 [Pirellulaceae bacterium SH449]
MKDSVDQKEQSSIQITWCIPSLFRQHTDGHSEVQVEISEPEVLPALKILVAKYPGLANHFSDETGKPQSYISIFHNDQQVVDIGQAKTLRDGDELLLVPALSGG